jgi:thiopeptide-type bacteriocin biosynthesis protein
MPKSPGELPLYTALSFAMVRAPLLPVECYLSLRNDDDRLGLLEDARVRRAVAVGSLSLLNALDRFERSAATRREEERLKAKLLRYQIRMSTRPTPYGLFAGCAIVQFGARTDLRVRGTFGASHTRPDMAWLMEFVTTAEGDPAIRRRLRAIRNPLIRTEGDRLSLAAPMPGGPAAGSQAVSLRATAVVKRALTLADGSIEFADLAERLADTSPSATPEKVERLLTELWNQTVLLTDLRPPLTGGNPARHVLDRLRGIPDASRCADRLEALLRTLAEWDHLSHEESIPAFRAILAAADRPGDGSKDPPVQVDLALATDGGLSGVIAEEAARAAELLLRLSPSPRGLSSLAAYRTAFVSRYGEGREVPLLELLDPDHGLGSPSAHGHAPVGPDPAVAATRSRTLLALACGALYKRERVIRLDDETLSRLETRTRLPEWAPLSLDINVLVGAHSAGAIDAGDFTMVVGPNLGAWAAGRNFGRFAHLQGEDYGRNLLRQIASAEEESHLRDHTWVEVVYLPSHVRSANVAVRPAVRSHEIVFGVAPGVPAADVVAPADLLVGVDAGRFYVRMRGPGSRRLHFVSGHMLNHQGAPPAAQFLLDLAYDGIATFTPFEWGPAEGFPYLPRVQVGRIVLRPAEWKLGKDAVHPAREGGLDSWRAEWNVPRHVSLTFGDNRLVLDLEQEDHARQLMTEASKLPDGRSVLVQEVLPALEDAWLPGGEGHYYSELIVPLVLRPCPRLAPEHPAVDVDTRPAQPAAPMIELPESPPEGPRRLYPPGSEWLFVKLYGPGAQQDVVIGDSLGAFAANALASGLAASWFFIRYADPDPHLRVRFRGNPQRLSGHLFGQVCQWAAGLVDRGACTRFAFDTYDPETERYGGPAGLSESERLFHADSVACAPLVGVLQSRQWGTAEEDRMTLMALSVDDLLRSVGLGEAERLEWYRAQTAAAGRDSGQDYRRLKKALRAALGNRAGWLADKSLGPVVAAALDQRARDLATLPARLRDLAASRLLSRPVEALCAAYIHLHLNRLGGASSEQAVLDLLRRARESLSRAPVG